MSTGGIGALQGGGKYGILKLYPLYDLYFLLFPPVFRRCFPDGGAFFVKKLRVPALALALLLLFAGATALAAGSAADPLLSRAYWESVFTTPLSQYWETVRSVTALSLQGKVDGMQSALDAYVEKAAARRYAEALSDQIQAETARLLQSGAATGGMRAVTLQKGDRITGTPGAGVLFLTGSGKICGKAGSSVLNVASGALRTPGQEIRAQVLYLILADDGSGLEVTSQSARVLVKDGARAGYEVQYSRYAEALRALGLFRGTGSGDALDRAPTRHEALVMLLRLLGEEQAALAETGAYPFSDTPVWKGGSSYITYAYAKGYTTGSGKNTFSPENPSGLEQYLTFILRSLGYRDGVDFTWNDTSRALALQLGIVTQSELDAIAQSGFYRDHVVLLSYRALSAPCKDGSGTLADRLVSQGTVTAEALRQARALAGE